MSAAKRKEEQKVKEQVKKEDNKVKRAKIDVKKDTVSAYEGIFVLYTINFRILCIITVF